jgi:hypothetical protein
MAKTFDQSLDDIARLVKHYQTHRAAFHAPGYKEAHARQNLIDPLFIALDWDVYKRHHASRPCPSTRKRAMVFVSEKNRVYNLF